MTKTKRMLSDVALQLIYIGLTFVGLFLATKQDLHYMFRLCGTFVLLETAARYIVLHIQIRSEKQMEMYVEKFKAGFKNDQEMKDYLRTKEKDFEAYQKSFEDKKEDDDKNL